MKLPIYYNFDDFFHNYEYNLQEWKNYFPDGSEDDFIADYRKRYSTFYIHNKKYKLTTEVSREITMMVRETTEDYPNLFNKCDLEEFAVLVQDRIDILLKHGEKIKSIEDIITKVLDIVSFIPRFDDNYVLDARDFEKYRDFFLFQNNSFNFDEDKFKNFTFSLKRISKFLKDKETGELGIESIPVQRKKIESNGVVQILGYVYLLLLEGNHIEYEKNKNGTINKAATARTIFQNYNFLKKGEPSSFDYYTKAIFANDLTADKTDLIKIAPLKRFQ